MRDKIKVIAMISLLTIIMSMTVPAYAWSNGGYSISPSSPKFGTHDLMLQKAINMLPTAMKSKIDMTAAYYGSEIPDCKSGKYCIGDSFKHHIYYRTDKSLQDGAAATRAQSEYDLARSYFKKGDKYNFSLHLGAMSHYIADSAVFGHTMGTITVWGPETHHNDYENYVESHLSTFSSIPFDGSFKNISAYNAALNVAKETTFDAGTYTNVWMDDNYNWANPAYVTRTKNLINYDVNILADTIYTLMSP